MSSYMIYHRRTRPTGRELARMLATDHWGIRVPEERPDVLIRWGSRRPVRMLPGTLIVNSIAGLNRARSKLYTHDSMRLCNLPIVPLYDEWNYDCDTYHDAVLGRTDGLMGGRGITIYDPNNRYDGLYPRRPPQNHNHDFFSLYMRPTREVRIHVCNGSVIRVQGKYRDFDGPDTIIRNYAAGYRFRAPRQELHRRRRDDAIAAINSLGLDFGAVDMLLFGSERDHRILEVNAAPAMSPLTMRAYAGAIANLVSERTGGAVRLAPSLLAMEMSDLPEDSEYEESYL